MRRYPRGWWFVFVDSDDTGWPVFAPGRSRRHAMAAAQHAIRRTAREEGRGPRERFELRLAVRR